jgi:hypothetical protein
MFQHFHTLFITVIFFYDENTSIIETDDGRGFYVLI